MTRRVKREVALDRFDTAKVAAIAHFFKPVERCVRAIDVSLVVSVVVQFHDARIDGRFERVVVVRQRRKFVCRHFESHSGVRSLPS